MKTRGYLKFHMSQDLKAIFLATALFIIVAADFIAVISFYEATMYSIEQNASGVYVESKMNDLLHGLTIFIGIFSSFIALLVCIITSIFGLKHLNINIKYVCLSFHLILLILFVYFGSSF